MVVGNQDNHRTRVVQVDMDHVVHLEDPSQIQLQIRDENVSKELVRLSLDVT